MPPTRIAGLRIERLTLMAVILATLFAGCGSPVEFEPIPRRTVAEFSCRTSVDGLEIAVDPYMDPNRVKRYFGINLLSHPNYIVPLEVAFANRGADGGFELKPESVTLLAERQLKEIESVASEAAIPSGHDYLALSQGVSIVSPLVGLIIFATGNDAACDAQEISLHMKSVRFMDRPLYPSDTNHGFLYFKLDDISNLQRIAGVNFRVKNFQSHQEMTVTISLRGR